MRMFSLRRVALGLLCLPAAPLLLLLLLTVARQRGSVDRQQPVPATPPAATSTPGSPAPALTPPIDVADNSSLDWLETEADGVVRIVHQSWKGRRLPPRFGRWSLSFGACHPNWRRWLWTDADNLRLVRRHFAWFLPTYGRLRQPVQRADAARLLYMYKYGGVYCDLDCECLRPFGHLFANVSLAFGAMLGHTIGAEDPRYVAEGQIENSFMYSLPGHPFVLRLIRQLRPGGPPESSTGPYLLMREINAFRRQSKQPQAFRGRQFMKIFNHTFFNPFSWMANTVAACKDKGRLNRADELQCRQHFKQSGSYILQYHTQVWLAGSRFVNSD